jgi:hypothetical protein
MADLPQTVKTDEHGNVTDDSLPYIVRDNQTLERWRKCLEIAEKVTGTHQSTQEVQAFARVLFNSDYPTHKRAGEHGPAVGSPVSADGEGPDPVSGDQRSELP